MPRERGSPEQIVSLCIEHKFGRPLSGFDDGLFHTVIASNCLSISTQCVSFATGWSLPSLQFTPESLDFKKPLFSIANGDLKDRDFLELHFSEQSARTLYEKLKFYSERVE